MVQFDWNIKKKYLKDSTASGNVKFYEFEMRPSN